MNHRTTLYYREGPSDKVYQAAVEPKGGLFIVTFAYGRRGATLSTGTKTDVPVELDTAERVFNKLIKEKKAKGYTEGPDGTLYQNTDKQAQVSGILPQLLNPIQEEELPLYLNNPSWCMQEKHDGRRLLIQRRNNEVLGINRKGLIVGLPCDLQREASGISEDYIIDGEIVGQMFYAFDILERSAASMRNLSYEKRYDELESILQSLDIRQIKLVVGFTEVTEKLAYLEQLRKARREGVVFKRWDATYSGGRPASGGTQLKHKFYATASFLVDGVNPGKRSVSLALFSWNGSSHCWQRNYSCQSSGPFGWCYC